MIIRDEVFARLKNGEPPGQVRMSYRSQSQVVEGFRLFLDEHEKRIKETGAELAAITAEKDRANNEVTRLQAEELTLRDCVQDLRKQKAANAKTVDEKSAELRSLRVDIEALHKRGFTMETVTRLREAADLSGPEVWHLLNNVDARAKLSEEVSAKRNQKTQLECDVSSLGGERQEAEISLDETKKKISEAKAKLDSFGESVGLLESAMKSGLTLEDLRSLLRFLLDKQIGMSPCQSLAHFLQLLETVKNLEDLRSETFLAEDRLKETLKLEQEANARVKLVKETAIRAVEEQKAAALKNVSDYGNTVNIFLHDLLVCFKPEIEKAMTSGAEVAKLEVQAAQLRDMIVSGQALMGILQSDDVLRLVQPVLVIQLLERLELWMDLKWPKAVVNVFQDPLTQELRLGFPSPYGMKLSSVMKLGVEAIKQRLLLEPKDLTQTDAFSQSSQTLNALG